MSLVRKLRIVLIGGGLLGLATPLLFYAWIHGNSDRYLWIINQGYPCSAMGGGPFQLFVLVVFPWLASVIVLAAAALVPVRQPASGDVKRGLLIGAALIAFVAALMFGVPNLFAVLITC